MKHYLIALMTFTKFFLIGCTSLGQALTPNATTEATQTPEGWHQIAPGVEQRVYIPNGNALAQFITFRLDPQQVTFRVHYQSGEPMTLQRWRDALPDADLFINANFFTPENVALGLVVSDGVTYSQSYTDRGGTFGILDDVPVVRSNVYQPYQGESYQQAIQGFPMLVMDGQQAFTDTRYPERSRRTVIGIDEQGAIIVMATPGLGLSLSDLSAYLPTTDLGLVTAFNLDGGRSTLMYAPSADVFLPSFDPVPAILAVYLRDD
ncbi:phosphodiester glycosidase family protein [Phototrophicus methaneseepsis]|uniref:Phosphodiester glycosidase family protein n=1 Tax=Phototrophicus methaneseepsis TaxID=2710758 RepID=A0A7S8IGR9_9CHLR|nr:phosphodiester glycosidase family protein [Phototrophicus methaneseepsis]QPC84987.1 phosphodiester glycosidase family protein [Phototrophicus methaneseepsis]